MFHSSEMLRGRYSTIRAIPASAAHAGTVELLSITPARSGGKSGWRSRGRV